MTEATAGALAMLPEEGFQNTGTVGRLIPNMEAMLVDDDEKDVPQWENSAGELWLRGPNLMKVGVDVREFPLLTSTHRGTSTTRPQPEKRSPLTGG